MKALELLKNGESLLLVDAIESKKMQNTAETLNTLLRDMNEQINSFSAFASSQLNGEYSDKIVVAKSLAKFFEGNKTLKVDMAVLQLENEEKAHINDYYQAKTKLLDTIRALIKDSNKEAVVSNYDLYEGQFVRCESGHEIIILNGRNVGVLETLFEELDKELVVNGNFSQIEPQKVDYSLATLNRNVELCERKNNEIYGSKTGKLNKIATVIEKLKEVGEKVVAFYSYKNSLELIGCNPKNIKDYENELTRAYVPLKKTLQKELKIDLEDICEVSINEEDYEPIAMDEESTSPLAGMDNYAVAEETPNEHQESTTDFATQAEPSASPFDSISNENPFENIPTQNPFESAPVEPSPFESAPVEPSPFETTQNSNPFESVSTPNPFESEANSNNANPFDVSRPNPFDNSNNSNPFDN